MNKLNSHQFEGVYKDLGIDLDKLGCVMLDVKPLQNMYSLGVEGAGVVLYHAKNKARSWIDGWVADKTAHVTLLYGLLKSASAWSKHIEEVLKGWKLTEVEIEKIGFFDSPYPDEPYYCIVAHIKVAPDLLEGHQRLQLLPHIDTFLGYNPHMTIAYIDKKQGEGYRDSLIWQFNKLWKGKTLKILPKLNLGDK